MYQDVTSSFEAFYEGTSPRLLRYAYGLTGDLAEAQDLAQEAYARAWPRWKRLRGYENPESWLRLVVSRLAVDRLRWLGVRRARAPREAEVVPPPDEEMLTLVAALKRLPMTQRKALVLHYFLDMPVAEVAAEIGTNVNTVKTWLARGRLNVAAQLAVDPGADIQGVRDKARRRRNRTVAMTITAFLATAAAAAAAFLFVPQPIPPALHPDLILPYANAPRVAMTMLVNKRAIAVWHGTDGHVHVGAIDLASGRQPWPTIDIGRFDDSIFPLGFRDGIAVLMGVNDSSAADDYTLLAINMNSGTVQWRLPPQAEGTPLFDMQRLGRAVKPGDAGKLVILGETGVTGIDWRTGGPVWTVPSTADTKYSAPSDNRFAELDAAGVLRIRDVTTGRVISERSEVPKAESRRVMLLDNWLYLTDAAGLRRIPTTGSQPASELVDGADLYPVQCGKYVCAQTRSFVVAFDRRTGKQVWRKDVSSVSLSASEQGMILLMAANHSVILDPDGRDITPDAAGKSNAYWLDEDHLLLQRQIETVVITGAPDQAPATKFDLSVYSIRSHQEQRLGQYRLHGNCAGLDGKYVCTGDEGFILFH